MRQHEPPTPVTFAINGLAVYRATRLITADRISQAARDRIYKRYGYPGLDFITCPWCVSMWLAAGAVAATVITPRAWRYPATALALSAIAGLIAEHE